MSVYIPCESCQKRLKVPESVLGRSVKCPTCGAVFKSDPAKAVPAAPKPVVEARAPVAAAPPALEDDKPAPVAKKRPALDDDEDDILPAKKKAAALDDEDDVRPAKKKAAALDDEDEEAITPTKKRPAARDDDENGRPAKKKKRRADDDEDEDEEPVAKPAKRRTPWYVMLPLIVFSLSAVGLAPMWAYGFAWAQLDKTQGMDFDTAMWIGIGAAAGVTLLCLIFSLLPMRSWLRFLFVILLLLLGYGASAGIMYRSKDEIDSKQQKKAAAPAPLVVTHFGEPGRATA